MCLLEIASQTCNSVIAVGSRITSTMALQMSIPKPLEDYNTLTTLWLLLHDGRQGTPAANHAIFNESIVVVGPSNFWG